MALKIWITTPFFYPDMNEPWTNVLNDMIAIVDAAERLGFEGVMINENLFQNYVTNPSSTTFSAVAASRTKRLKIMPGVVILPLYHPLLVASEVAMLDHLAPGRINLGVARGGSRYQLDRLGVDPAKARDIYEESLDIIRRAWVEDDLYYEGEYYSFPETTIVPKPLTQPHPNVWVAAQSVDGTKKVAEKGLNLLTAPNHGNFEPYGDLEEIVKTFNESAAESGLPRGEVMTIRHTWLGRTEEEALEYFDDMLSEYNHYRALVKGSGATATKEDRLKARTVGDKIDSIVAGLVEPEKEEFSTEGLYEKYADPIMTTPDKMIERFKAYEEIGVDHIACLIAWGQPIEAVIANMELMAAEVLPAFAD